MSFLNGESSHVRPVPTEKVDKTYKRLRIQTFLAATFGYALYYVCRLSMGVMKQPLIDAGLLTATQLGIITACLYWAYALGKLVNGFLADSSNIKRFMAFGLVISVAMNFTMGILGVSAEAGEAGQGNMVLCIVFAICWGINGWAQSMGAPPAIISLSRWFPLRIRGTFYGFFSSSHNIGEGLSFVFVSALVAAFGWKWGFFGAAIAGVIGVVIILLFLHNSTESKGLPSIEALSGEEQPKAVPASERRAETRRLQKMVIKNPGVWILAAASAFMYMSRYAINEWGTFFMQDAKGYELEDAAFIIGINPIFGIIGTVVSGWLSDVLFKGDRKYPAFVAGVLEAIALAIFLFGGNQAWVNIVAMVLFGIAIGVLISFVGGLMAIDLVPRKATGAALGIVGLASYAAAGIMTLVTGVLLTTHPVLPSEGNLPLSNAGTEITLTAEDVEFLQSGGGLTISGDGFTLTQVSLVSGDGEKSLWDGRVAMSWDKGALMNLTGNGNDKEQPAVDWSAVAEGSILRASYTIDNPAGCIHFGDGKKGVWNSLPSLAASQPEAVAATLETVPEVAVAVSEEAGNDENVRLEKHRVLHDFSVVRWLWIIAAVISFLLPILNWKRKQQVIE